MSWRFAPASSRTPCCYQSGLLPKIQIVMDVSSTCIRDGVCGITSEDICASVVAPSSSNANDG